MAAVGGSVRRAPTVGEIQRERILDAVVETLAAHGMTGASVRLVLARAKVSRGTFYEHFDGLDDATVAVMDDALAQLAALASQALAAEEGWRDGVRAALAAVLAFFDREPALARVCVVEALAGGAVVLERRERILEAFRALVVTRIEGQVTPGSPLAAEGVMASVIGIVHAHIVTERPGPLIGLLGPLMGLVTALYVEDSEVQREIERGGKLAREMLERSPRAARHTDTRIDIPDVLLSTRAHHARQCLRYIATQDAQGLSPSNRQVGEGIGLTHRGQIARLLGKLTALGLLAKRSEGPGYANEWSLTPAGAHVARSLPDNGDTSL